MNELKRKKVEQLKELFESDVRSLDQAGNVFLVADSEKDIDKDQLDLINKISEIYKFIKETKKEEVIQ